MVNWVGFADRLEQYWNNSFYTDTLIKSKKWAFNTIRIPLPSPISSYIGSYTWNDVLNRLDQKIEEAAAYGLKTIIDYHIIKQNKPHYPIGSQGFIDIWVDIAQRYRDNPNVQAYELTNEPNDVAITWISSLVGDESYSDKDLGAAKMNALIDVINAILAVDPVTTIVFPPSRYWSELNPSDSRFPSIPPNVYLSYHPYTYSSSNVQTYDDLINIIASYRQGKYETYRNAFDDHWTGEFESHQVYSPEWERDYAIYMINWSLQNGYGVNYWKYGNSVDDGGWDPDFILEQAGMPVAFLNTLSYACSIPAPLTVNGQQILSGQSIPVSGAVNINVPKKVSI